MTEQTKPSDTENHHNARSRREALFAIARAGTVAIGAAGLLSGCATAADRRVKARGGSLGEPLPNDPTVVTGSWSPAPHASAPSPSYTNNYALPAGLQPRSTWAKGNPRPWLADPMGSIRRITVHHDAIDETPSNASEVASRLDSIRRGHLSRGWADIGYHFAIDPAGRVWQCRPLNLQGAHVANQNQNNLGIVMLGNFERQRPTDQATAALDRLIASEMQRYRISLGEIRTHREMASTACPGRNLQRVMDRTRTTGGRLASLARGDIRG